MMQQSRKCRSRPLRRTLTVEPLEDRVVPAGPNGVVTAVLNPTNGVLTLQGNGGNNTVRITPSPLSPNLIRVQGQAFTSINAVTFTDFTLSSITSLQVTFLGGQDSLTVQGFSIPGNLRVTPGNGVNTLTVSNFNSNTITLTGGNDGDTATVSQVRNGATNIMTGAGTDTVSVTAANLGSVNINTGTNNDSVTVAGSTVGNLSITEGNQNAIGSSNDVVSVTGNTIARATINVFNIKTGDAGVERVTISNNTFSSNAANAGGSIFGSVPSSLTVNVNANPATGASLANSTYIVTLSNNSFNTGAPAVLNNGSLRVQVGTAIPANANNVASTVALSQLSGLNDATLVTGGNFNSVSLNNITARSLNTNVGGNSSNFSLTNTTVAGPLNASVGDGFTNVTLNNILVSVTPIDLALGRQADLTLSLGDAPLKMNNATLTNLNIGRNLTVTNGNGDTMFIFTNVVVGQTLTFGATPGKNDTGSETLMFNNVKVLDALMVQLATGIKAVSALNTTCGFGMISANNGFSPNSNVFWDQGGNAGFFVDGFDNFLVGPP